MFISRTMKTM